MNTESGKKNKWLAITSLILGILSFGLVVAAFIPIIWGRHTGGPDAKLLALGFLALVLMLGGLLLGLLGLVISLIALRRKMKEGGENRKKGIAITGLVLSGLGVAIVCILLALVFFFGSSNPPPIMITPSPLIPLTPIQ